MRTPRTWILGLSGVSVALLAVLGACLHGTVPKEGTGDRRVELGSPRAELAPVDATRDPVSLERLVETAPAEALRALDELDAERGPEAPGADARSLQRMRALVHLDRITPARDEGNRFFARWPQSPLGPQVTALTGVRPRPRLGPATP